MHDSITSFERELTTTLDSVANGMTTNRVSTQDVRNWTREYLRDHAEELVRYPELQNDSHWNMFARDDMAEDALFVLLTFTSTEFGVLVGRGSLEEVHDVGLNCDGDVGSLLEMARIRFPQLSDSIAMPISCGYYWAEAP